MAVVSSVVAGVASAGIGAYASNKARKGIQGATNEANAEQRRAEEQARADMLPYREAGASALNQLADPTNNFYASPDYEFRRGEGMRDIGNQFAARGGGGNAMKALAGYNSNLASGEFGNWFDRTFAQAEAGRGAAGQSAQVGMNAANNIGANTIGGANQQASLTMGNAANINNAMMGGISNVLYSRRLDQLKKKPTDT